MAKGTLIRACNSVVCLAIPVTAHSAALGRDSTVFHWIRWDYHQKGDFVYWPLDWDEDGWHSLKAPFGGVKSFRIDTHGDSDPRTKASVWRVPDAAWANNSNIPVVDGHFNGFLGNVNHDDISRYSVNITAWTADGSVWELHSAAASGAPGEWVKLPRY